SRRKIFYLLEIILSGDLSIYGFTIFYPYFQIYSGDLYELVFGTDQPATSFSCFLIIIWIMLEGPNIKSSSQLPVYSFQEVQVKESGYAGAVVVSIKNKFWIFFKIEPYDEKV